MRRVDAWFVAGMLAVTPAAIDAQAPAPAGAPGGAVSGAVEQEWAKFDHDHDGRLTPLEFGEWVMTANGQDLNAKIADSRGTKRANLTAVRVLNVTSAAFSKADTNHDRAVSPEELTTFLTV